MIDQGVDALVIDAGGGSMAALAERAGEGDVPVIAVDDATQNSQATASVVGENVVAGRLAAEYLFFRMGGTGAVAAIVPSRPGPAGLEVHRGFEEIALR
ncbi:MAG TPA: substrate-binding domain-containing protein, partial [Actinomycetota bacterium]|nr:substrate-binding domain-containing protein [Actinomycetota bacterium]